MNHIVFFFVKNSWSNREVCWLAMKRYYAHSEQVKVPNLKMGATGRPLISVLYQNTLVL